MHWHKYCRIFERINQSKRLSLSFDNSISDCSRLKSTGAKYTIGTSCLKHIRKFEFRRSIMGGQLLYHFTGHNNWGFTTSVGPHDTSW